MHKASKNKKRVRERIKTKAIMLAIYGVQIHESNSSKLTETLLQESEQV